jgi:hypothetical protein
VRCKDHCFYLSIALAMSLDFKMTQRPLAVTHAGGLHSLIKRDAAVIHPPWI